MWDGYRFSYIPQFLEKKCRFFLQKMSRNTAVLLISPSFCFFKTQLHAKQNDICKQNLDTSSDHCSALLQDIFGPLEEAVKQGIYSKPGGHTLFLQKTEELKAKYYQQPRKGIQVSQCYQSVWDTAEASLKGH